MSVPSISFSLKHKGDLIHQRACLAPYQTANSRAGLIFPPPKTASNPLLTAKTQDADAYQPMT